MEVTYLDECYISGRWLLYIWTTVVYLVGNIPARHTSPTTRRISIATAKYVATSLYFSAGWPRAPFTNIDSLNSHSHDDVIKWKHFPRNWPFVREFPAQRPVMLSFDVFFDLRPNKRLSKQSWSWWFKTPPWSLWRHCNEPMTFTWVIASTSIVRDDSSFMPNFNVNKVCVCVNN